MITQTFAVRSVVERNIVFYRRYWHVLVAALVEPMFWLLGIGIGLGELVGDLELNGDPVRYAAFIAPALIATSAMNAAAFDSTFNFYYKLRYAETYDSMLATPLTMSNIVLGEVVWSVVRATIYAAAFLVFATALDLVNSWWAVLIPPVAVLIGLAVSALGILSTTFMRNWHDFDYLGLVLQVLFLCSATFFPLSVYPAWSHPIVFATPLYHGVALCRDLALGSLHLSNLANVAYLVILAVVCGRIANRRLNERLLR